MYQRTNLLVVNSLDACHSFLIESWHIRSLAIVRNLGRILASRDGASDSVEHEYPAQSELAHGNSGGQ